MAEYIKLPDSSFVHKVWLARLAKDHLVSLYNMGSPTSKRCYRYSFVHFSFAKFLLAVPNAVMLDVRSVYSLVKDVADWFTLGILLGLQYASLEHIERNHPGDTTRRKQAMIAAWLEGNPHATWRQLADALKEMNQQFIAHNLEEANKTDRVAGTSPGLWCYHNNYYPYVHAYKCCTHYY